MARRTITDRDKAKVIKSLKSSVRSKSGKKDKKFIKKLTDVKDVPPKNPNHKGFVHGNQFYKLRSKHGRDKVFASPAIMMEAFEEYCKAKAEHPWYRLEKVGKNLVQVPTVMPLTWDGFCIFCEISDDYFFNFERNLNGEGSDMKMSDGQKRDFLRCLNLIRKMIRDQKFNGAAAGYFKEGLISYDLGIRKDVETTNVTNNSSTVIVKDEEDKKLLEDIRKKLKE